MLAAIALAAFLAASTPPDAKLAPKPQPGTAQDVLAAAKATKGKAVLVNAWATWCLPCRQEMPDLLSLRTELRAKGFELVLVTTDFDEDLPAAQEFLGGKGVDFETFQKKQRDPEFIEGLDASWSGALPFSVLFDRNGNRSAAWEGKLTRDEMLARVLPLLETHGDTK
jgi:thiol-disulfide isomerase/thioredoxin